jgi:protease II
VDYDSLGSWKGIALAVSITIQEPGSYRQELTAYLNKEVVCPYAKTTSTRVRSRDGTSVPCLFVSVSSCKPKHLLCSVYGAYGMSTRMNTDRWKPLLDRGFVLCIALVRGGGDHTDAWAEEGRRETKVKSVEDFEACIRAARKKFHIPADQTFLYGRSAGGYTVGATLSRNASGSLFQGVYTEVPYVDVLNTTSNPELPLTQLEYDEFGNPHRVQNAQALLHLSPIDSLPSTGAPKILVLSRTASNDKEVFAYESVKWITRLQDLDKQYGSLSTSPKLLAIQEGEGHFAPLHSVKEERAKDMAILHFWALHNKKSHGRIYQMANTVSRKNRRSTRKNNVAMRKRRNNVTMGGKRKRSTTRKGRKGSKGRKH